ncbi:hypothetical protein PENTCL1PPCAC_28126 [Pristionchus entomophagus]|uniref:Uncharacterized protein n=1 Tax=Pristionchus entomophagus TaxID=358040 RepID=A0AAV5UI10_9BILA|nr:hypothetical protein PENTCL1PPCAC_28126 [Pristionchus entomophagus]
MIWLAHHHNTFPESSQRYTRSNPFSLNGTVYYINSLFQDEDEFAVYRLHPTTLEVQKIEVLCENFTPLVALSYCIVFSHQNRLIIWDQDFHNLYLATEVDTGLSFRRMQTTGVVPNRIAFAYCMHEGKLVIHGGMDLINIDTFSTDTLELNLKALIWTRRQTVATEEVRGELAKLTYLAEQNLITGDRMHVINLPDRSHFILDLSTNVWTRVRTKAHVTVVESPTFFTYDGNLYLYGGKLHDDPGIIYRFDEENEEWKTVLSSLSTQLPCFFHHVTSAGTRVYLSNYTFMGSGMEMDFSVLEMNPTLFDLSAMAVQNSLEQRALMDEVLPAPIKDMIVASDDLQE